RNLHASAALIVNEAVIPAFDRIAAEPSRGQRQPPVCAMISQRHRLARFGAVEDNVLAEDRAAKRNASDLVAPGPHIPLITQEHWIPPCVGRALARQASHRSFAGRGGGPHHNECRQRTRAVAAPASPAVL